MATEGPLELNEAEETVLRKFDLAGKFGPCSSMCVSAQLSTCNYIWVARCWHASTFFFWQVSV